MGDLVLKGATSGQITVTPTAIAGTNTLTLPAKTGNIITSADSGTVTQAMLASNVAGNGPAFSAYRSGTDQSISAATWTKVQAQTEEFDTNSNYDNATNYRFTPTVAGYYMVTAAVTFGAASGTKTDTLLAIYKNGAEFKRGIYINANSTNYVTVNVSALINFNGSTDYIELYGYLGGATSPVFVKNAELTYFQASLVRAA